MLVDCFMFNDEYAALQLRFEELHKIVDQFIIVEARYTFRGEPKPLNLDNVWHYLAPMHDKIYRVIVDFFPENSDPWSKERYQRDAVTWGLRDLNIPADAKLIVSDADEVPKASVVEKLNVHGGVIHLDMNSYYFYLDWKVPDEFNQGGRPFVVIKQQMGSPQDMRDNVKRVVLDGAWHFSYMGGPVVVKNKIQSFSHSEYDTEQFANPQHLAHCAQVGRDPFDRFDLEPVEIDETYPKWVQENTDRIPHLLRPRNDHEERGILG